MVMPRHLVILFRAAAGPRVGFGHLVRCGVLARVLGVDPRLSLRGSAATARVARERGWQTLSGAEGSTACLNAIAPDLLVIDDPSTRSIAIWVRAARRHGIPVVTVHDLGVGHAGADLSIDGSLQLRTGGPRANLHGTAFAILDPAIAGIRATPGRPGRPRVLISLGGGAHTQAIGPRLAARIRRVVPHAEVELAIGLTRRCPRRPLPAGCRWLVAPHGLTPALAAASVAVVAGGVTLYEACAVGTPVVTVAVTRAQRDTTRAFSAAGAAIDASASARPVAIDRAAAAVARLIADPRAAAALGRRARRLVDGRGAHRVARHLLTLIDRHAERGHRHAGLGARHVA
jgi:UDP-2,4-diacetamido-2,4,6-trideoxy-beta-L-altropyranose hydrolase